MLNADPRHAACGRVVGLNKKMGHRALPNCAWYLNLVGHTVLHTAAYYFRHELPKTEPVAATLLSLDTTVREMRADWF
ncbi:hypothetical protein EMIHUDRAFT_243448 [Emiliania huxleyi CCMP1516]|uniref:Uncharacterized protein n=2 Tax=Emiliania huxleyi TaxID=2903 RepID=A0A0D3J647_EMIH1|nr:hypothetical protein EMIHUDRAFT_243448 [Emiliania huxleyi CCMP1516]EOD18982.1 hypothetical protein EMIHUDRAFT_243448 [Emiliania huxleyi CCMP1516]|eukprot:XP_005771411.1 hypothetical protein EMIHUDRAFT_243448 [Emiliania huxleyi CCMP1516]